MAELAPDHSDQRPIHLLLPHNSLWYQDHRHQLCYIPHITSIIYQSKMYFSSEVLKISCLSIKLLPKRLNLSNRLDYNAFIVHITEYTCLEFSGMNE